MRHGNQRAVGQVHQRRILQNVLHGHPLQFLQRDFALDGIAGWIFFPDAVERGDALQAGMEIACPDFEVGVEVLQVGGDVQERRFKLVAVFLQFFHVAAVGIDGIKLDAVARERLCPLVLVDVPPDEVVHRVAFDDDHLAVACAGSPQVFKNVVFRDEGNAVHEERVRHCIAECVLRLRLQTQRKQEQYNQ